MTIQKKFLSLILALAMALSLVPAFSVSAFADAAPSYLTFTAEEDNSSVKFDWFSGSNVMYSTRASIGAEWSEFTTYTANTEVKLASGGEVRFKANQIKTENNYGKGHFSMTGKIAASGSVTSLTDGNGANPYVQLSDACYTCMFKDCTSLTTAPSLPATALSDSCYFEMFEGCTSLTTAPALPATTLADDCYGYMFYGCTSLTSAPELPATALSKYCYESMFMDCTSLTSAPNLPATTLAYECYYYMFSGCTSLTTAPALPATTLADECYYYMFSGCTSLTSASALPATTLAKSCYSFMFLDCTSLTSAPALSATTLAEKCCYSMFSGCIALTSAPALPATTLAEKCYMFMFSRCTSLTSAPVLPATELAKECYNRMFNGCTALKTAPEISATTLAEGCCEYMFQDCTSLTNAPALPATTLADKCYYYMFNGCTALTSAPALPATTLAEYCYAQMFYGCTSLINAPALPATTLADCCYYYMFKGCTSLTTAPALPATELAEACYFYMFKGCTALTSAPALPATTLTPSCYNNMFNGCTSLSSAPELPATTVTSGCYQGMFSGCTSLTNAPELKATEMADYCYLEMFKSCTSLTSAPALSATTLAKECYKNMFNGCTKLYVETVTGSTAEGTTWNIPYSTATNPAIDMAYATGNGNVTVEVPTASGVTNYYKVSSVNVEVKTSGASVVANGLGDIYRAIKARNFAAGTDLATNTDLATATDLKLVFSFNKTTASAIVATATDLFVTKNVADKNPTYYEVSLLATATDLATPTDIYGTGDYLVELVIPSINTSGKAIDIYREHKGTLTEFKQKSQAECTTDGTFYIENEGTKNSKLHIFTNKFSIYAICSTDIPIIDPAPTPIYYTPDAYSITLGTFKNGSVTASKSSAYAGDTVTLTVKADKGWTLETLTVTDKNGKEIELTAVKVGESYTFVMPYGAVNVSATFMEDNTMLNFCIDVTASDYYYDAVLWAYENGITDGVDNLHFAPKASTTRGQMVTYLWRAAGSPVVNYAMQFTDIPADEYYTEAVRWAASLGITDGVDDTHFAPNAKVTRAQVVAFLWRYAGSIQFANMTAEGPAPSPFKDVNTNAYYYNAVLWAKAQEVTDGTSETTFSPNDSCIRAMAVTFLYNYFVK